MLNLETLLLVMVVVYTTGVIFRKLKLPIVLGELLAGLVFGPALLGVFYENETIGILAELGIFFLMLHAGMETEPEDLVNATTKAIWIGVSGFLLSFGLGFLVTYLFGFTLVQAAFVGLGLSATAISITIKILRDHNVHKSTLAHTIMGAAVVDNILAFIVLSVLIGLAKTGTVSAVAVSITILKVCMFFGITVFVGHAVLPYFNRIFSKKGSKGFTFALIIALAFGLLAQKIGLHYVIGAYVAGIFIREEVRNYEQYHKIEDRIFAMAYSFLGPIFFLSIGFHIRFDIFMEDPLKMIGFLVLVVAAASAGKIIGCGVGAKLAKYDYKEAGFIGNSMNVRGTVELIIALIGLELGIIGEELFSILVLMAFITTLLTTTTLHFNINKLNKRHEREQIEHL